MAAATGNANKIKGRDEPSAAAVNITAAAEVTFFAKLLFLSEGTIFRLQPTSQLNQNGLAGILLLRARPGLGSKISGSMLPRKDDYYVLKIEFDLI